MSPEPSAKVPSIGRIVHYTLSQQDADYINGRRTENGQPHIGNRCAAGNEYPAVIVAVFGSAPSWPSNLQVFLDGEDQFWGTSRHVGEPGKAGTWHWPEFVPPTA